MDRFLGGEAHTAVPVSVVMILSFFWEELDGAEKTRSRLDGARHRLI